MSFPVTKLYLWPNDDAMVVKRIHSKLLKASRQYLPVEDWEVLLVLKLPRIKQKLDRDALSVSSSLSTVTANDRSLVRDDTEKDNRSYFFLRFADSDCTVQMPQVEYENKDLAKIWEPGYEEKISKKNELNVRTSWKISGKQFFVAGRYIVSAGVMNHGELTLPVFEITDSAPDSSLDVKASYRLIDQLIKGLLSREESKVQLKGFIKDFSVDNESANSKYDLIDRSVQWLKALKALEEIQKEMRDRGRGTF